MFSQQPLTEYRAEKSPSGDYDSDEEVEQDHSQNGEDPSSKRRKFNEDERVQRCRERNRVHARNTRERKRAQMDLLQQRIQELSDEKKSLETYEPEESVASILMSLSGSPKTKRKMEDGEEAESKFITSDDSSKRFAAEAIERIKSEISATLSDDEELDMNSDILLRDKSGCSTAELEMIRRERNRMHAKKTRLRKKKMLSEMESIIYGLERDIRDLRKRHNLGPDEYTSSLDFRRRPTSTLTISGAVGGSKFTGFRHVHRSDGGVRPEPQPTAGASVGAIVSSSGVSSVDPQSHAQAQAPLPPAHTQSAQYAMAAVRSTKTPLLGVSPLIAEGYLFNGALYPDTTSVKSEGEGEGEGSPNTSCGNSTCPSVSKPALASSTAASARAGQFSAGSFFSSESAGSLSGLTGLSGLAGLQDPAGMSSMMTMRHMDMDHHKDYNDYKDFLGNPVKRSNSDLSGGSSGSGTTSCAGSVDDYEDRRCVASILCLAATATATATAPVTNRQ